ncbi:MAG TPA: acetyltransferase [Candidatus Acidoferrales bacterium]|jgi:sugar O-acyltransferase (sialic acid O-acetyltransferase NeuD family)|nr:acetyltransferase [Candidatus Acidoferrales bacterium]
MDEAPDIVIIGAGGHASVLIDALRASGDVRTIGAIDADRGRIGRAIFDVPVLGDDTLLPELAASGTRLFAIGVGGTRDNAPRARLFEAAIALGLQPVTIVHPAATISRYAHVGAGAQILAAAVVNASARIGKNVIVNTGAVVEHDCVVGDHAHISTGACLASTVTVGTGAHVGVGAAVRQSIVIGADAVVGAGAVVVKDVAAGAVVTGVPAKEFQK